jgi:predicted nucleic acid-binding protein
MRIVVDTNVFIGAVMSAAAENREVLRRCLNGQDVPVLGAAPYAEYQSVLARPALFLKGPVSGAERELLFDAFCASEEWVTAYFLWRPNLPDEADNHLIELALNGNCQFIVTWDVRHLRRGELSFPELRIVTPKEYLAVLEPEGE